MKRKSSSFVRKFSIISQRITKILFWNNEQVVKNDFYLLWRVLFLVGRCARKVIEKRGTENMRLTTGRATSGNTWPRIGWTFFRTVKQHNPAIVWRAVNAKATPNTACHATDDINLLFSKLYCRPSWIRSFPPRENTLRRRTKRVEQDRNAAKQVCPW